MPTWTSIFAAPEDVTVPVDAAGLREMLVDLIGHPGVAAVQRVTLHLRDGRRVALSLGDRPALTAGASGPMQAGAALATRDVAPLVYAPERAGRAPADAAPDSVDAWAADLRRSADELRRAVDDAVYGRMAAVIDRAETAVILGAEPVLTASRPAALTGLTNAEVRAALGPLAPKWAREEDEGRVSAGKVIL